MKKSLVVILTTLVTGPLGGYIGYTVAKKRYIGLADKEVASIKAMQQKHDEELIKQLKIEDQKPNPKVEVTPKEKPKPVTRIEKKQYSKIIKKEGYAGKEPQEPENPIIAFDGTGKEVHDINNDIYLITDHEFNESQRSFELLYYYQRDGVIADTDNNRVNNYKELIGSDSIWLDEFDEEGKETVHVRNDKTEIDYEIILCHEAWMDVATPAQKAAALNIGPKSDD